MFFDFFLLDFSSSESLSPLPLSLSLSEINFFFCLLLSCLTFVFDSKKNLKERNQEILLNQKQRLKKKGRDRKGN
jgi:hypothetical protein